MTLDVIDRMVRQANPVPDLMDLEPAELDDATFRGAPIVNVGRPGSSERDGRGRRLVLAAAAVVLVALGGTLLVRAGTDDGASTKVPTEPGPSPTTRPEARGSDLLPPAGSTPSPPERGELVVSVGSGAWSEQLGESSFNVFADGRLIRVGRTLLGDPTTSRYGGQVIEQRLTPEGVELVRSEFLAAGLVGPGRSRAAAFAFNSCFCVIRVRDGDRLLETEAVVSNQEDPEVDRRVDRLLAYVLQIESRLPASAWAVRDWIPFVPSRYLLCVSGRRDENDGPRPVPDAATTFRQHLPAPIARLLARSNDTGNCPAITFERAREVAEALDDAGAYGHRLQRHGLVPRPLAVGSPGPDVGAGLLRPLPPAPGRPATPGPR